MARIAKIPPKAPLGVGLHRTWYNATIDAIEFSQEKREKTERPKDLPRFLGYVKNTTIFEQYVAVKIKNPMATAAPVAPYAGALEVEVEAPTPFSPWGVLQAPLSAGYPSPIIMVGEAWAKVTLGDPKHTHARLDESNPTGPLVSGFIGQPLLSKFGTGIEMIYITPQQQHNIFALIPSNGIPAATNGGATPSITSCELYKQTETGEFEDLEIEEDILHYGSAISSASDHDYPYLPLMNTGQFFVVATEYCN